MPGPERPRLLLRLLPRRAVSRWAGRLARVRWPGFLLRPVLRWYARRYGVRLEEARLPLAAYPTFAAFFTRDLADGLRPMPSEEDAIACPCDGRVAMAGTIEDGTLLQVKGRTYALADLLEDAEAAAALDGGTYLVLYLAPGDYHGFHWPFDGRVRRVRHVPGDLWSVDERGMRTVHGVLVRNERVVTLGETRGGGAFAYVPVGAINVGSIRLAFHDVRTNRGRTAGAWEVDAAGVRGERFGGFELGSTLVLALAPQAGRLAAPAPGTPVRLGEAVGALAAPASRR
jgi:phosphatidylserine decarboxylase